MAWDVDPVAVVERWVSDGVVKGASLCVTHRGRVVIQHHAGLARFTDVEEPVGDHTLFMIASPTKTITASCVMQYVEEGAFALDEPVAVFLPEFGRNGKEEVTFRHLLTHTSGLPEQVEGKDELRARQGSMEEFLERIYGAPLRFRPGTGWSYSNCGFAVLARVVEGIESAPFGEILRRRVLEPLKMNDSALGFDASWDERVAEIELPRGLERERAFLNTRYWRGLGAPWGAMASTAPDLVRFAEATRLGGALEGVRILAPATVEAMVRDQLHVMPGFPEAAFDPPHGLAWRIRGRGPGRFFGDLTSPATYGHTGATGTFIWVDPLREVSTVLLANKEGGNDWVRFARLSNAVMASIL